MVMLKTRGVWLLTTMEADFTHRLFMESPSQSRCANVLKNTLTGRLNKLFQISQGARICRDFHRNLLQAESYLTQLHYFTNMQNSYQSSGDVLLHAWTKLDFTEECSIKPSLWTNLLMLTHFHYPYLNRSGVYCLDLLSGQYLIK